MTADQLKRDIAALDYKLYSEEAAKRLEYEVRFAEMVFKALVLTNGGAMVALFSLAGAIGSEKVSALQVSPFRLWFAFLFFSLGLVATLVAGISAYFTQRHFSDSVVSHTWIAQAEMLGSDVNTRWSLDSLVSQRRANIWLWVAIVAIFIASIGFVAGSASALLAVLPK